MSAIISATLGALNAVSQAVWVPKDCRLDYSIQGNLVGTIDLQRLMADYGTGHEPSPADTGWYDHTAFVAASALVMFEGTTDPPEAGGSWFRLKCTVYTSGSATCKLHR